MNSYSSIVLRALKQHPMLVKELQEKTGMEREAISRLLRTLRSRGKVQSRPGPNQLVWALAEESLDFGANGATYNSVSLRGKLRSELKGTPWQGMEHLV